MRDVSHSRSSFFSDCFGPFGMQQTVEVATAPTTERAAWTKKTICMAPLKRTASPAVTRMISAYTAMKKASTMPPERSAGIALSMKQTMPTGSIRAQ